MSQVSPANITATTNKSSPTRLACSKCTLSLGDQLVEALDGAFHPECFTCWVLNNTIPHSDTMILIYIHM